MSTTPHDFSTLKKRVELNTLYEIAVKKQLSDEEITALIDVGILDSTTLNEKIEHLSPRNSEESLISTDSDGFSASSGSTADKPLAGHHVEKTMSIKDSERVRFTGKKWAGVHAQNKDNTVLRSALVSH
jgi:hypothetical protein